MIAALLLAVLLGLAGRKLVAHFTDDGASSPHFVVYTTVAGDTPASVASVFAADPAAVMRASGSVSPTTYLAAGVPISINASRLWERLSGGSLASPEGLVENTARRLGVQPATAVAVAWQESRLDQTSRSVTGAIGIMQVEPGTSALAARDLGATLDPTVASDNVVIGIFWLRSLLTSYHGDLVSALAAYYEGPGNLARRGYLQGTAAYVARATQIRHALLAAAPELRS